MAQRDTAVALSVPKKGPANRVGHWTLIIQTGFSLSGLGISAIHIYHTAQVHPEMESTPEVIKMAFHRTWILFSTQISVSEKVCDKEKQLSRLLGVDVTGDVSD